MLIRNLLLQVFDSDTRGIKHIRYKKYAIHTRSAWEKKKYSACVAQPIVV